MKGILERLHLTRADALFAAVTLAAAAVVACAVWGGALGALFDGAAQGDISQSQGAGAAGSSAEDAQGGDASAGPYAVVQNTDGYRQVLPLSQDTRVEVVGSRGTNVVEVAGGRVRVVESDCSNQICVNSGWASMEGQTITCLPHQLVVQVVANESDAAPLVSSN